MATQGPHSPPPEAALIRLAREAQAISPETAAKRMRYDFSGSSWRQIEAGYRGRARTPVVAKASTLAHMALVVGVSPDRLAEAGREDAAEVLREIERQEVQQAQTAGVTAEQLKEELLALNLRLARVPARQADKEGLLDQIETLTAALRRIARNEQPAPGPQQRPRRTAG